MRCEDDQPWISCYYPPFLNATHEQRMARGAILQRDLYDSLRAARESQQKLSQGGVLSVIQPHLTKLGLIPID